MAQSIVKVPSTAVYDFDFLAFSFGGKHSYDDFSIYRTSDGSRYTMDLSPSMSDSTAEVPSSDGMYFFKTTHKQKDFNISFAFDDLSEEKLREMKLWLNGKELQQLWFEEAPYKVYTAKVTGQPQLKTVCFTKTIDGEKKRVYKGEGTVVFTAYWPYGHTPDLVSEDCFDLTAHIKFSKFKPFSGQYFYIKRVGGSGDTNLQLYDNSNNPVGAITLSNGTGFIKLNTKQTIYSLLSSENAKFYIYKTDAENTEANRELIPCLLNGKKLESYGKFYDKECWGDVLLTDSEANANLGENIGELPAHFIFSINGIVAENTVIAVGELAVTVKQAVYNLQWDSKTGVVSGTKYSNADSGRKPVAHVGNTLGGIPVEGVEGQWGILTETSPNFTYDTTNCTLEYHYWYY